MRSYFATHDRQKDKAQYKLAHVHFTTALMIKRKQRPSPGRNNEICSRTWCYFTL